MHEFKNWILLSLEKYKTSKTFISESGRDPPQEPYRSKYKAQEVLNALLLDLETKWKKRDEVKVATVWALLKYDLGVIALETEEYSAGCDFLTEGWEALDKISKDPQCCVLALSVLNQLGILWSGRGEPSKALMYLKRAEDIYYEYKENSEVCPASLENIFEVNPSPSDDWKPFEKVFTLTLYYLAQVYEHLKDSEKSAKYCHMTLKRQKESEEFEEKDWAVNSATLSQYYIQEKDFTMGRHLLACSTYVLLKYEASIDNRVDDEDVWDDIRRAKAEIAWCWLKYVINLLSESANGKIETKTIDSSSRLSEEEDVYDIENKVFVSVSSFNEARKVFLFGQDKVKETKLYYHLSDHCNNYVQIVQDHSKLYKNLILYEKDLSRQSKMQKRRLDMLEEVLSKLNPQYYLSVCRQLRFELGETYYELVDLKTKIMNSSAQGPQILTMVKKINALIMKAIDHFKSFIETLKSREGLLPVEFTDDLIRPALVAHFYLGSLYTKLIESDTSEKLHNLSLSEENYRYIINYSEKNPDHASHIEKELPVVKEMIELMPERILQTTGSVLF